MYLLTVHFNCASIVTEAYFYPTAAPVNHGQAFLHKKSYAVRIRPEAGSFVYQ